MTKARNTKPERRMRGFERTGGLLQTRIRKAGEKRGFAVSRVLTHWPEIVGEDIARVARPVNVSYGKGGFGATLTLLTTGAQAPVLAMQRDNSDLTRLLLWAILLLILRDRLRYCVPSTLLIHVLPAPSICSIRKVKKW